LQVLTKESGDGEVWGYVDGETLHAGFILNSSAEARTNEAVELRDSYTIVARPDAPIKHGDVLMRSRDKARYRITSDFARTPDMAHEQIMQASAVKLPKEEVEDS